MRKAHVLGRNLLLTVGSMILFFSILEIGTRLFWRVEVQKAHVGIIAKEGNQEIAHEGELYKTNSHGLRNKELQTEKVASAERRILALGDSFVWGDGLPEEDLVTVKIESLLYKQSHQKVAVINAGIPGFNTIDEFQQLVRLTPKYKPDLAMVFFFTNDVLAKGTDGEVKGNQVVSWKQNVKESLRQNSKFAAFLYYLYKSKFAAKVGVPQFMLPADYFNLDDSKPGWVAFKDGIIKIQSYCQANNIEFLFVMIPTLTNLDVNYPYSELREKVVKYVKSRDIHLIDLFGVFANYQPSDLWVSLENSHWNGKATTIAADEIVTYIRSSKLLK